MATKNEDIIRGQELYIIYIYLFGNAVPLAIKAAIRKLVKKRGQSLSTILTEKKEHIRNFYNSVYKDIFEDSNETIEEDMKSWKISTLCNVVFILNDQPNVSIKCILDQLGYLKDYAKTASLDYQTFQMKYTDLKESLLELCKDTDVSFQCKHLIYSFDESKAKQVRSEVNDSLNLSEDVDTHIEIVAGCVLSSNFKSKGETEEDVANGITKYVEEKIRTEQFALRLRDTILLSGERGVLMCELNKDDCQVVWSKNGEILTNTKTVSLLMDKGRHFLVFSRAIPEESGTYRCTYNDMSTSASLIVLQKPDVFIEIPLHNEHDGDVREYMKVTLSCTLNLIGMSPRWFHNDREIKGNNANITILSKGYEHKLIIHHVEFADNGLYMVVFDRETSKTSITVKDHIDLTIKQQIKQKLYKNWMIGVLGLKYLKLGLEQPTTDAVKSHHEKILRGLPSSLSHQKCSECNSENLLPLHTKKQCPRTQNKHKCLCTKTPFIRRQCPSNGLCNEIYDMIVHGHRFQDPAMRNTRMGQWKTDAWSIAECYMNKTECISTSAYHEKNSAKGLDCAELLTLFVNNKTYLTNTNYGVFDMARSHRNELLHNPNLEISDDKLREYLKDFKDVLEVQNDSNVMVFAHLPEVKQSLIALNKLQQTDIEIITAEELEEIKKEVRDAAKKEAAEKLEKAMSQKDEELRQMQTYLKNDRRNTIENMCEKHDGYENSWFCMDHGKLICRSCMENEHRMCCGNVIKHKNIYDEEKQISLCYRESHELEGSVIRICVLSHGNTLILIRKDKKIYELCKLNRNYSPTSDCLLTAVCPIDMCYIGNNKVVGAYESNLVLIDVAPLHILHKKIEYEFKCLACHGDMIYGSDLKKVFTCTLDGANISTLCTLPVIETDVHFIFPLILSQGKLEVSSNGESIYCIQTSRDMYKIDSTKGEILISYDLGRQQVYTNKTLIKTDWSPSVKTFKSSTDEMIYLGNILCMSYMGGGQVIVCSNKGHVLKVSDSGNYVVSNIGKITPNLIVSSACYDRTRSRLLLGDESGLHIFEV